MRVQILKLLMALVPVISTPFAVADNGPLGAKSFVVEGSIPYVATVRRAVTGEKAPRIVGGEEVKPQGSRPWQVALVVAGLSDNVQAQFCGGTLISQNWVATAAHCVDNGTKAAQVAVVPGMHALTEKPQRFALKRIVVHPNWNPSTMDSDIALLELDGIVALGPKVKAIPFSTTAADPATGTALTVSGWGATKEGGPGSALLMTVNVPVVALGTCNQKPSYDGEITANMLCAGREQGGIDSCQGDSGGPAVTNPGGSPTLVGIVSWGEGCARKLKYGLYTHVGRFSDWIKKTSGI